MGKDYSDIQVQTYVNNETGKEIPYVVLPAGALTETDLEVTINLLRKKLSTDLVMLLSPETTRDIIAMGFPEFGQLKATEIEGIITQHQSHELLGKLSGMVQNG